MASELNRRDFLSQLGVTVGAAAAGTAAGVPLLSKAERAEAQADRPGPRDQELRELLEPWVEGEVVDGLPGE